MVYSSHKTSYCYEILCAITGLLKLKLTTLHTDDIRAHCILIELTTFSYLSLPVGLLPFQAGRPSVGATDTADRDTTAAEQDSRPEGAARQPVDHHGGKAG